MDLRTRSALTNAIIGFLVGAFFMSIFSSRSSKDHKGHFIPPLSVQSEDNFFVGPIDATSVPARREDFVYKSNQYQELYDKTWTEGGYPRQSCWGCRFATDVLHKV